MRMIQESRFLEKTTVATSVIIPQSTLPSLNNDHSRSMVCQIRIVPSGTGTVRVFDRAKRTVCTGPWCVFVCSSALVSMSCKCTHMSGPPRRTLVKLTDALST